MKVFAEKVTKEKALVYDLRAVLNGEKRYFIVQVPSAKRSAFLKVIKRDAGFRLEDYGSVLHRGWNEPDDELKALLHERYGMYPDAIVAS